MHRQASRLDGDKVGDNTDYPAIRCGHGTRPELATISGRQERYLHPGVGSSEAGVYEAEDRLGSDSAIMLLAAFSNAP